MSLGLSAQRDLGAPSAQISVLIDVVRLDGEDLAGVGAAGRTQVELGDLRRGGGTTAAGQQKEEAGSSLGEQEAQGWWPGARGSGQGAVFSSPGTGTATG